MKITHLFLIIFAFAALFSGVAYAQDAGTGLTPELLEKPFKEWQLNLTTILLAVTLLGRAWNGLRTRGGLIGVWRALLFGENLPTTVAKDYSVELGNNLKDPVKPSTPPPAAFLLFMLLGLGAAGLVVLPGCTTVTAPSQWNETTITKVSGVVQASTTIATSALVLSHPDSAPIVRAVADAILAASDSTYDPAALQLIVLKAVEGSPYATSVTSAFTLALGVYQTFYAINVENALDAKPAFKAVLLAIATGAKAGASGAVSQTSSVGDLSLADMQLR